MLWNNPYLSNPTKSAAEQFFYGHAGYSYGAGATAKQKEAARRANARALARAEAEAARRGWHVDWIWDEDPDTSWMDEEDLADYKAGRTELVCALLKDKNGVLLDSICGVHLRATGGRDPYARVLEAEMVAEALKR